MSAPTIAPAGASIHVHGDDVSRFEDRQKLLLDIGAKAFAVDRRSSPSCASRRQRSSSSNDRAGRRRAASRLFERAPAFARHVRRRPGLVDEDELFGIEIEPGFEPGFALGFYARPILLARMRGLLWNGPPLLPAS
jgi:hypothetical protein